MKLEDNFDELNKAKTTTVATLISAVIIVVILGVVLLVNRKRIVRENGAASVSTGAASDYVEVIDNSSYQSTGLNVSDLDFYDMYKDREVSAESDDLAEEEATTSEVEYTEATDGKHTLVTDYDGTSEWVVISPYLAKHNYDFSNLLSNNGKMKYFEDSRVVSSFGVDISKDNDYIDFVKLKKAGCDFVMIRVGARGYETGTLSLDDYFKDNLKRATDADLDVGLYFLSEAINETEAIEEANYVIENIGEYELAYPIAFVMKYASNDKSRIDTISKNNKSMIARAFLNTVKKSGYKAILYGDKAWLIKHVDLSKLISDFDIWYSEPGASLPNFPYKFAMWQYERKGTIDGISGYVNFNICFLDYSLK